MGQEVEQGHGDKDLKARPKASAYAHASSGAGLAPASDGDEDGVADDVDGGAGFDIVVDVAGDGGTTGVPGT